jgi:hypothetical protein
MRYWSRCQIEGDKWKLIGALKGIRIPNNINRRDLKRQIKRSEKLIKLWAVTAVLRILLVAKNPWPDSASELYRPIDRHLSAKLVPTFEDRGSHVVSDGSLRP